MYSLCINLRFIGEFWLFAMTASVSIVFTISVKYHKSSLTMQKLLKAPKIKFINIIHLTSSSSKEYATHN